MKAFIYTYLCIGDVVVSKKKLQIQDTNKTIS